MFDKKIEVDKLPTVPSDCPYSVFSGTMYYCDLAHCQKLCTYEVGASCYFLHEKEREEE